LITVHSHLYRKGRGLGSLVRHNQKLKFLDLIAPCRLHALFLPQKKIMPDENDASCEGKGPSNDDDGGSMGNHAHRH
jgi:hypothetical protein